MNPTRQTPGRPARATRAALAALPALATLAMALPAQGVRILGSSTARYVELRPFVDDSVPIEATVDSGSLRRTASGTLVQCVSGLPYCRFRRSGETVSALPVIHDLQLTAWGLGRGVSVVSQLRVRTPIGDEARALWPREDDDFDALTAYIELDRERVRARAGRQWVTSGLGVFNYDGASLTVWPLRGLSLEAYGGWSLARGLNEPRTSGALAALEEFPPNDRGTVWGGAARWRPSARVALGAMYQREIRTDRGALYSERAAADAAVRVWRGGVDARLEGDFGTGRVSEALLHVQQPVTSRLTLAAEARRYRPTFELWTIWGAFDPVGFTEARMDALWGTPANRLALQLTAGRRSYDETFVGLESQGMRDDAWRVGGDATLRLRPRWTVQGGYHADVGFGASRTDGDLGLRWEPSDRATLGVRGTAFQSIYEFRVGTGRVVGGGIDGALRLTPDLRVVADAAVYRHTGRRTPELADWSQRRATVRLEWSVGPDPGRQPGGAR